MQKRYFREVLSPVRVSKLVSLLMLAVSVTLTLDLQTLLYWHELKN